MNSLHIKIKDESKLPLILSLLRELPFVEIEESTETKKVERERKSKGSVEDLFGLWAHRDVTLNDIREKAWNRRAHDTD